MEKCSLQKYSVSQKNPPWGLVAIFPKWLGIFQPNFTRLLRVPIYARLRTFIQLSATVTKLCHIKRDHPVQIMSTKCAPSAETHAGIWKFGLKIPNRLGKNVRKFQGGDFFYSHCIRIIPVFWITYFCLKYHFCINRRTLWSNHRFSRHGFNCKSVKKPAVRLTWSQQTEAETKWSANIRTYKRTVRWASQVRIHDRNNTK